MSETPSPERKLSGSFIAHLERYADKWGNEIEDNIPWQGIPSQMSFYDLQSQIPQTFDGNGLVHDEYSLSLGGERNTVDEAERYLDRKYRLGSVSSEEPFITTESGAGMVEILFERYQSSDSYDQISCLVVTRKPGETKNWKSSINIKVYKDGNREEAETFISHSEAELVSCLGNMDAAIAFMVASRMPSLDGDAAS